MRHPFMGFGTRFSDRLPVSRWVISLAGAVSIVSLQVLLAKTRRVWCWRTPEPLESACGLRASEGANLYRRIYEKRCSVAT